MARINLLPWRLELRKARQRQFAFVAAGAAVFAGLVLVYAHLHISGLIDEQESRNKFMREQIAVVDRQIKEIQELEKTKANLLARMRIIQELQRSRPQIVHLFDELVKTLPEGVYLTSIAHKGNNVTLLGVAQSNARVSAYMRNVEKSLWMKNPRLEVIQTTGQDRERASGFTLHLAQSEAGAPASEEGAK